MYLLKNGFLVDPENGILEKMDILIERGIISEIKKEIINSENIKEYDLAGKTIFPGFIDMHVHLREPGREDKETIETGLKAALAGGFTGVGTMPNTNPICDNKVIVDYLTGHAKMLNLAKLYPLGAASKKEAGKELAEIGRMHEAGIVAVSDDGQPVVDSMLMRRIFEYIKKFDIPFIAHSEDKYLSGAGVMNEGKYSLRLGLKGIPNIAESIMVGRDILLCELTNSRLHIAHASTEESLKLIKEGKDRGIKVTVEITPHHFTLIDEEVEIQDYDTDTKVNPPLRSEKDRQIILEHIKKGYVDIIATDHAPHTKVDKTVEFNSAPFGFSGLETAVSLVVTELLKKDVIDLNRMAELMSVNPRKIYKIDGGIKKGKLADLSIIDLEKEWIVDVNKFYSKGKNTPFKNKKLQGKPYMTIVNGEIKMIEGEIN